jgi:hypothetical protein
VLNCCIDPHFLDLGTSWRWVVSFTPLPLYPRERAPGTHYIGGWVDPRAGLDDMEKWNFFILPGLELVFQPVTSRYTDWAIPAPQCTIGLFNRSLPYLLTQCYGGVFTVASLGTVPVVEFSFTFYVIKWHTESRDFQVRLTTVDFCCMCQSANWQAHHSRG